jgi:hypothetical protein
MLDHSRHPAAGPLCEGMWFSTACHTEMAKQLAMLWPAMSSVAQSVLGCSPTETFQADVVGETLTKFLERRRDGCTLRILAQGFAT